MTEDEGRELAAAKMRAVRATLFLRVALVLVTDPTTEYVNRELWLSEARKFLDEAA